MAERALRRISERRGEAVSDISSSDRTASFILSSRYLLGISKLKRPPRPLWPSPFFSCHSESARSVRSTAETLSSSAMVSIAPASALRSSFMIFSSPPNGGEPYFASSTNASSVSASMCSASSSEDAGETDKAACAASPHAVSFASIFSTLSSSRVVRCFFISLSID